MVVDVFLSQHKTDIFLDLLQYSDLGLLSCAFL